MAITRYAGDRFTTNTSDTKPTGVLDGAYLIDTGNLTQYVRRTVGGTSQWTQLAGGGGGGGTPGGSNTQVQFNNAGAFAGNANLTFDGSKLAVNDLALSGIIYDSNNSIGNGGMVLTNEGTTGVNWKSIESVLSGVGGSGVANYVARWSDEDTLTSGTIFDNGDVGIGTANPGGKLHVFDTVISDMVILESSGPSAADGPDVVFYRNSASPADNDDLGKLVFRGRNDNSQDVNYANIIAEAIDVSDGTEDGALKFYTYLTGANTETMVLRSANVGIGTNAPDAHLHIEKSVGATTVLTEVAANSTVGYEIKKTGSTTQHWKIVDGQTANGYLEIYDATDSATRMAFNTAGNVGIGTVNAGQLLTIKGDSKYFGAYASDGSLSVLLGTDANGDGQLLLADVNGTTKVLLEAEADANSYINNGGNVGIGTNAPATKLHVEDSTSNTTATKMTVQGGSRGFTLGKAQTADNYAHLRPITDTANALRVMPNGTTAREAYVEVWNKDYENGANSTSWHRGMFYIDTSNDVYLRADGYGTAGRVFIGTENNTQTLTIKDNGRVGVGTNAPNTLLHLEDDTATAGLTIQGAGPGYVNAAIVLKATNGTGVRGLGVFMHDAGGDTEWYAGTPYAAADNYVIARKASQASPDYGTAIMANALFTIDNNGNVGLGITDPAHNLHVSGDAIISGYLYDSTNSTGVDGYVLTSKEDGPQWKMIEDVLSGVGGNGTANYVSKWVDSDTIGNSIIYDDGDVGISTASPDAKLHVFDTVVSDLAIFESSGPSSANAPDVVLYRSSASPADADDLGRIAFRGRNDNSQDINYANIIAEAIDVSDGTEDGALRFNTYLTGASTETMVLRSANVGIGTNNPGQNLQIHQADSDVNYLEFTNTTATTGTLVGLNAAEEFILWHRHDSDMVFATNAVEKMRIENGGDVGIGTNSAGGNKLYVYGGGVRVDSNGSNANGSYLNLRHANNNTTDVISTIFFSNSTGSVAKIVAETVGANNSGVISFHTENAGTSGQRMTITADGKIGIGTASPSTKLDIQGGSGAYGLVLGPQADSTTFSGRLYFEGSTATNAILRYGSYLAFTTGATKGSASGTVRMAVMDDGDVGIGTVSPSAKLHINNTGDQLYLYGGSINNIRFYNGWLQEFSTTGGSGITSNIYYDGSYRYRQSDVGVHLHIGNGEFDFRTSSSGTAGNVATRTQRMVITNGGLVGIGVSDPDQSLEVAGAIKSTGAYGFYAGRGDTTWASFGSGVPTILLRGSLDNSRAGAVQFKEYDGTDTAAIYSTDGSDGYGLVMAAYQGDMKFSTGSLTGYKMVILSGGNVGIGTNAPGGKLESYITSGGEKGLRLNSNFAGGNTVDFIPAIVGVSNAGFSIDLAGSTKVVIGSTGLVGIGTNNPAYILDVYETTSNIAIFRSTATNYARVIIRAGASGDAQLSFQESTTTKWTIGNDGGDSDKFKIVVGGGAFGTSPIVAIDTAGKVGVGSNAPAFNLDVTGTGHYTGLLNLNAGLYLARESDSLYGTYIKGGSQQFPASPAAYYSLGKYVMNTASYSYDTLTGHVVVGYGNPNTNNSFAKITFTVYFRDNNSLATGAPYVTWTYNVEGKFTFQSDPPFRVSKTQDVSGGAKTYELQFSVGANYGTAHWKVCYSNVSTTNAVTIYDYAATIGTAISDGRVTRQGYQIYPGCVGIGTDAPTSPLTIKSSSTSATDSGLTIQGNSNTNAIVKIAEKSTDGARLHLYDGGVEKIAFYTDGTANHISAGSVGIGTNNPSNRLHIEGTTLSNASIRIEKTTTGINEDPGLVLAAANNTDGYRIGSIFFQGGATSYAQIRAEMNGTAGAKIYFVAGSQTNPVSNSSTKTLELEDGTITAAAAFRPLTDSSYTLGQASLKWSELYVDKIKDVNNSTGSANQILSAGGSGGSLDWVSLSEITGVDGSGTANTIPRWTDSDTIGDSIITVPSNTSVQVAGPLTATGNITVGPSNNSKIYMGGNDYIAFTDGVGDGFKFVYDNSEKVRITNVGNVGIGTNNPEAPLHILGGYDANDPKTLIIAGREDSSTVYGGIQFEQAGGNTFFGIGNDSRADRDEILIGGGFGSATNATALRVFTGTYDSSVGTERLTILSGGQAGFGSGTFGSNNVLTITNVGNDASYSAIALGTATTGHGNSEGYWIGMLENGQAYLWNYENQHILFGANNTERMRINSDGNVGIGTNTPATKLDIWGGTGARPTDPFGGQNQLFISQGGTSNAGITISADNNAGTQICTFIQSNTSASTALIGTQSDHALSIRTNNTDRITIASDGDVDIAQNLGVGGAHTGAYKFYVHGNSYLNGTAYVDDKLTVDGDIDFETMGDYITFYGDSSQNHSISSRNSSGVAADDIRINTYGALFINLDSNGNDTSEAHSNFQIGRHAGTGAVSASDLLLNLSGETGKLRLYKYGSGTHTGTAAYKLSVDSSGNVIETAIGAGAVDGSGTANKVTKWTDSDTIGDSQITDNGTSVGINQGSPNAANKLEVSGTATCWRQLISAQGYTQAPVGVLTIQGPTTGGTTINSDVWGLVVGPQHTRSSTANTYYAGIAFNHLLNHGGSASYNNAPQAWIGTRLHDTSGSERDFLVFATKSGTGTTASDVPLERMCIDPVYGSVGIGATDPNSQLQVQRAQTTSAFTDAFLKLTPTSLTNTTGLTSIALATSTVDNYGYSISGWRAGTDGSPHLAIKRHNNSAAGVDVMAMDSSGHVGIGTNDPAYILDVYETGSNLGIFRSTATNYARLVIRSGSAGDAQIAFQNNTSTKWSIGNDGGDSDKFKIAVGSGAFAAHEVFTITTSGSVGIGTGTPTRLLHVSGTAYFSGDIYYGNTVLNIASGYSNQTGMGWDESAGQLQIAANNTTALEVGRHTGTGTVFSVRYASTQKASIDTSGNMSLAGTLTEASSLALKENIEDFTPSLDIINKIRPVKYNKKKESKKEIGLIAEELAELFPELVDRDNEGNPSGVNYSRAVTVLLGGFKELYKEIEELKKRI
jgi:hypothetical protein